ncbi:MAG TPA: bifunctional 2-polyprenyl-6-hydroxyphenol methylase/3-demethylubiquinol 3-O-methyltransferase UbiG [Gammaproteobacteria bacterium]|nr:bifunctional 2-polyprenyl-6-hydroxyphenol methylase/3-demethylubiquinol 3-O-methyltransferase UbiG [Gammaproteobacteria bacterium]
MKSEDFQEYAKDWWDPNGPLWTLHAINPLRTSFIHSVLGDIENLHVADIGCGAGILCESLHKEKAHITGIDSADKLIDIAEAHAKLNNLDINYICNDGESFLQSSKQSFDVIILFELLEHLPDPEPIIHLAEQKLKKNGTLFISTINRNTLSFLSTIIGAEYLLNWVPKGTHRYDWFLKPSEIIQLCNKNNLKHIDSKGLSYYPVTHSFALSNDMLINYFLAFKRFT